MGYRDDISVTCVSAGSRVFAPSEKVEYHISQDAPPPVMCLPGRLISLIRKNSRAFQARSHGQLLLHPDS